MAQELPDRVRGLLDRRRFLGLLGAGSAVAALGASARKGQNGGGGGTGGGGGNGSGQERVPSSSIPPPTAKTRVVRLYSVVTAVEGGLLGDLVPGFERQTGYRAKLTARSPHL